MGYLQPIRTKVELISRRTVRSLLDGRHASRQHTRSLDFSDLREYAAGDDIADVDWKASARHGGTLLVKRYVAERRAVIQLVVETGRDLVGLLDWDGERPAVDQNGLASGSKLGAVVEAVGALGWISVRAGDPVGLAYWADGAPRSLRPSGREIDLERALAAVVDASTPTAPARDVVGLLDYVIGSVRRRTVMVVVLAQARWRPELEDRLRRLAAQHDLLVVTTADADPTVPARAGHRPVDLRTGRALPSFLARAASLSAELAAADETRITHVNEELRRLGVTHIHLSDSTRVTHQILNTLEERRRGR